jgi:hypothetical protein
MKAGWCALLLAGLTPRTGDSVKVGGVLKTFDGAQWR